MTRGTTGGKREREANRDRRKQDKADRLRKNREPEPGAAGGDGVAIDASGLAPLPAGDLADVVSEVAAGSKHEPLTPAKLFVGGLSWDTTSDELQVAFSNFGKVTDASVICDQSTGRSRGFGFVTFAKHADADEAIKGMNGRELDGRPLKVNRAESP